MEIITYYIAKDTANKVDSVFKEYVTPEMLSKIKFIQIEQMNKAFLFAWLCKKIFFWWI